ncbi:leukocyte receptor cluster member 9 [Ascaphus truei]|uniref:leukocyte receptor cluster member 9 n=1 Tax=Ascaphus truei TaxID=8439 RepID=UPI003F598B1B
MDKDSDKGTDPTKESMKMDTEDCMKIAATENEADQVTEAEKVLEDAICQYFLMGRCRFGERCRNVHTDLLGASLPIPVNTDLTAKGKKASEGKGKKPPMKTADDVISRIQWDTKLPSEYFSIGYIDRFLGIIEKPFSAFCWEDLASVGHDVLAIPKHRIQHFKYQSLVVWDKTTRTDNVFGSTGSGMTILDIIDKYDDLMLTEKNYMHKNKDPQDDEDLVLMEDKYADDECSIPVEKDNTQKLRPSHFVAIHISSEEVRSSVKEIQNTLLKTNPDMATFCTPLQTLHITLCLLYLDTPEEIQRALSALQELKCEIQRILPPSLILSFEGLKDFHSRVLYLAPSAIPEVAKFARALDHSFRSNGLTVIDSDPNNLHVTIAKIPKNVARKNPSLLFSHAVYGNTEVTHFGAQPVDSLSFCYAGSSRRSDGFYTTLMEFSLY